MGYSVTYRMDEMSLDGFIEKYREKEKFLEYCKACPNYNNKWSCPELSFEVDDFLGSFNYIYIVGAKMTFDRETIEAADTMEKVKAVGWEILETVKGGLADKLLAMEKKSEGSVSLAAGGCTICSECTRPEGKPCRFPQKMRHSLDSFGVNLSRLTEDAFGISILWIKDKLPDYFTLVHALLAKERIDESSWSEVGFKWSNQ